MSIPTKFRIECTKCSSDECEVFINTSDEVCVICPDCGSLEEGV